MIKRKFFFLAMLLTVLLFSFPSAFAKEKEINAHDIFILPFSLQEIEEEAFANTAADTVIFPDGLLQIGKKAFEGVCNLIDIYIPESVEFIADTAFSLTSNLTIHGVNGSYAQDWAEKHSIPFVVDDIWNVFTLSGNSNNTKTNPINRFIATIVLIILFSLFKSCYYELRSRRPQDRPELNPIDYRFP